MIFLFWLQEKICRQDRVYKKKIQVKFILIYECFSSTDDNAKTPMLAVSTYRIFRHLIIKPIPVLALPPLMTTSVLESLYSVLEMIPCPYLLYDNPVSHLRN